MKAVLRGKFIAINAYIKKQDKSQIKNFIPQAIRKKNKQNPKLAEGKKS